MLIFIVIILLIVLFDKNSQCKKLLEENRKLKKKLNEVNYQLAEKAELQREQINENKINQAQEPLKQNLKEQTKQQSLEQQLLEEPLEQQAIEKYLRKQTKQQQANSQQFEEEHTINKENAIKNEKEQKNIIILVTGAICIVLSAIVFLMSTWNSIPNILKTIVLSLLTLVFFGGSYIAKEKFKLDKASQTFFYIAMAYIPICLISIAIFGLFGTYLSIYGEGKFIYLTVAALFVAFIYYATYMNKDSKYLLYGSILSQVFSIIAFSLIFSNDILIIGINLLLYNILLILITKKEIFMKLYNFIPAMITVAAIIMLGQQAKTMIFLLGLLATNFLILELKNSQSIYSYMFNISFTISGIYTISIFRDLLGTNMSHLLALCFVILLYIGENMLLMKSERKNLKDSLSVVTILTIGILHIESFINTSIITPYIISTLQILILIITYIRSGETGKDITAKLIPLYFIITGVNIINALNGSYHIYIIFAFLTFIIGEIFRKRDELLSYNTFIISHIFIVLTYIIVLTTNFNDFIDDIIYGVLLTGLYVYSYLIEESTIFKYLSYITSNFALFTIFKFFVDESEILYYIPMISTLAIMGIELKYKKLQDEGSSIYLAISKVISFAVIYSETFYESSEISTILAIIFAITIIIYNIKYKEEKWNILPLTCVIPAIFLNDLSTELKIGMMLLAVIATAGMSLKEKKVSVFTVFSGIYLFFTSLNIESTYLKEILFICWSVVHFLLIAKETEKDVFKFSSYLSVLFLYNSIIAKVGLETYTLFSMLGYVLIAILTSRTILIKYIENIDTLEYIVFGIIYLIALFQYNNELDGMLFGFLLVAVVMASYISKYGALFMITTFAILVNIFILTREFWFSVPWWVYLLTVGSILIGFAIKNERSEKKNEINAINVLKNIKDRIEKE